MSAGATVFLFSLVFLFLFSFLSFSGWGQLGYVVYAAMVLFGMASPHASPSLHLIDKKDDICTQLQRQVGELVNKYVLFQVQEESVLLHEDVREQKHMKVTLVVDFLLATRVTFMRSGVTPMR